MNTYYFTEYMEISSLRNASGRALRRASGLDSGAQS
jgi:hypothetical protein